MIDSPSPSVTAPLPAASPSSVTRPVAAPSSHRFALPLLFLGLVILGVYLRWIAVVSQPLWVDEAESSLNALTILQHGVPTSAYLGLPLFENTLTEPWPENPEYEFRDSSYSPRGLAVYHGWLPLYSIAAADWLAGIGPDLPEASPRLRHGADDVMRRTVVPRLPAIAFSVGFMAVCFGAARRIAGDAAGVGALTWAAISERAVMFGHQARYYSLTLLLCGAFLLTFLRVYRRGSWMDYSLLGVVVGLLFHTHQLSALVVCGVAALGLPRIVRQEGWLPRALLAAGIAAVIIVPWLVWSGFLSTLSRVPMVFALFTSLGDWFGYVASHGIEAAIGLGGFAAILLLERWRRSSRGERVRDPKLLRGDATMLLAWVAAGLVAFHTLIPAASFFAGRLTLMLLTPYLVLVAVAVGLTCERLAGRWAVPAAAGVIALVLLGIGEIATFRVRSAPNDRAMEPALDALAGLPLTPQTRLYAPPNEHLVWTYYSGLPVQSIAPVRKAFLDNYAGDIHLLERRAFEAFAPAAQVRAAAIRAGAASDAAAVASARDALWMQQVSRSLRAGAASSAPLPPIPRHLREVATAAEELTARRKVVYLNFFADHPLFKGRSIGEPDELWATFFYRFVGPEGRTGEHANFQDRLRRARVRLVPAAAMVIYSSPGRAEGAVR